ncbi:MAG: hypothetical protein EZS28_008500 [Streblomastix strix]|uniref:Protein kinase domain-containing protein n=1 Tax=Streblomastix strix TaxID=222440 RepID=A0A5J4WLW9_9EUKA|nr:MAG: hypothetical protein EZS28_008500 [Streblomastix strix]
MLNFEDNQEQDFQSFIAEFQHLSEKDRIKRLWALIGQMTLALNNLHSLGFAHRNLKPSNIFINQNDGSVRFGAQKFYHAQSNNHNVTISVDPVVDSGIIYFENVFKDHEGIFDFAVGLAEQTVTFMPDKKPQDDGNDKKIVAYWSNGCIRYSDKKIFGNSKFKCGQKIGMEINMDVEPRTLFFFVDDVQQKNYVIGIPDALRFWSFIQKDNSSYTISLFERRGASCVQDIEGSTAWEYESYYK